MPSQQRIRREYGVELKQGLSAKGFSLPCHALILPSPRRSYFWTARGTFLVCSFWLADAYVMLGRLPDATKLFERLLRLRNDLGLLAEEYDPRLGRLVGNFPPRLLAHRARQHGVQPGEGERSGAAACGPRSAALRRVCSPLTPASAAATSCRRVFGNRAQPTDGNRIEGSNYQRPTLDA